MKNSKWVCVNLNDEVKFKVTKEGEKIWEDYYMKLKVKEIPKILKDRYGFTKMDLWEMAHIFGPSLIMGYLPPIEMNIQIKKI